MLIFARAETRLDDRLTSNELLAAIEDLLDVPLTQFDADCDCQNQAPGILVQINKDALLGVVINLIENALQACGKGAELVLTLKPHPKGLAIRVCDDGPGMSPEQLKRVTEPFYTTKSHGTGLGLAVAQVVTKAHGGEFTIESTLGQGTCAEIAIPVLTHEKPEGTPS